MRTERFVLEKYRDGTITLDWTHFDGDGRGVSAGPRPMTEAEATEKLHLLFNPPKDASND